MINKIKDRYIRTHIVIQGGLERMDTNLVHFKWDSVWIVTS